MKLNHNILTNNKYLLIKEQQEFFTLLLFLLFFFLWRGFLYLTYFVFDPINALFSMRFELDTVNQPCPGINGMDIESRTC